MARVRNGLRRGTITSPPARLSRGQLLRISLLWFGLQFFWAGQQQVLLPERVRHFTGEAAAHGGFYLGLIRAAGAVVVLIMELTIGYLSDHAHSRLGRRRPFILYGISGGLIAILLFLLAPGYWWLLGAYLLLEATIDTASVPFQALLPDLVPEEQHSAAGAQMGLNFLLGQLGGLLLAIAVTLTYGAATVVILGDVKPAGYFALILPAYCIVLVLSTLAVVFAADETRLGRARAALTGAVCQARLLPGIMLHYVRTAPTLAGSIALHYLRLDLRQTPDFMWLAFSRFAIYCGYWIFLTWANWYTIANLDRGGFLRSLGMAQPQHYVSLVHPAMLMFFILSGLLGNALSVPLAARFGKKAVIGGGLVWSGLFFIPMIFAHSVWTAVGAGSAIGLGWGAFLAADWAFACSLMPRQHTGSYMGVWDITSLLPQVLAPFLTGPLLRDPIMHALTPSLGALPAEARAYQWTFALVIAVFAAGLVLLRNVREARIA